MKKDLETGIYIHIPFCVKKCGYCDFLSAPAGKEIQHQYINALLKEIEYYKPKLENYKIRTVYIGGGTPSVLETEEVIRIAESLQQLGKNKKLIGQDSKKKFWEEATIEVNPGTITEEKLKAYQSCGFDRLSIGLQSTNNEELKILGRIHTFEQFLENYRLARAVGFQNINIDLMSALPGQTLNQWKNSLYKVTELEPEHISAYSLIIEENTQFEKLYGEGRELETMLPSEELDREMYEVTKEILKAHGYDRYEISNYAKKGKESKHNSSYWQGIDYVGMGLGASSCFQKERYHNTNNLKLYMKHLQTGENVIEDREKQTRESKMEEFMFLGLRMMEGISKEKFKQEFQISIEEVYGKKIQSFLKQGFLKEEGDRIALTENGINVSNMIFSEFLL